MSEFGKGLCYNLGLFLAHAERFKEDDSFGANTIAHIWFNGASGHLYEMQTESAPTPELKKRCDAFKTRCLKWGHGLEHTATKRKVLWSIQEAKDILRAIDSAHGVETEKGKWE